MQKILSESDNYALNFIGNNWGLAINIKSKFRYLCQNNELLGLCIEAFENAEQTYLETRNSNNGKKYEFVHHWAQHLKSLISANQKKQSREVSFDEMFENGSEVLSSMSVDQFGDAANASIKESQQNAASEIVNLVGSKKAQEIVLLYRHGYAADIIAKETRLPEKTVGRVLGFVSSITKC